VWEEKRSLLPKNRRNELESSSSPTESPVRPFFLTYYQKVKDWAFVTMPGSDPLVRSYLFLRKGIGIIGVALPFVLIIGAIIFDHHLELLGSMSAYYYSVMGNVFVGSLWAIGIFLICYQYDHLDDLVSTVAGVCVIGLSLFPTTPNCPPSNMKCLTELQIRIGMAHFLFATGFLVALAFMAFFLFTREKLEKASDRKRKRRKIIFRGCGIVMFACIVVAAIVLFVPYLSDDRWQHQYHPILIIEIVSTLAFGVAWFVKGETYDMLKAAIQRLPLRRRVKSGLSAVSSQSAVEQPNGLPAVSSQPAEGT
jgi:hypothetical protein